MKTITARYDTYINFCIPEDIILMSLDEVENFQNEEKPGYWWIKWGTLYYIDKNGKTQEIEPSSKKTDTKWSDDIEVEEH